MTKKKMELTQSQADDYMAVKKRPTRRNSIELIAPFDVTETLTSNEYGDIFKLDLKQGCIELDVFKLGNRAHDSFTLYRLDIDDKTHRNPDGTNITGPHLHIYKEGFNDLFAYDATKFGFTDFKDLPKLIEKFAKLANIEKLKTSVQTSF